METAGRTARWAKVLDQTRCIGCHACSTACKSENLVPLGVNRTYVKAVEVGRFPAARRAFQVTRCNQCDDAPCTTACPTRAMFRRKDGIVDFDKSTCIGCKACIAACPYDAIFINPDDGAAEKCNLCSHRVDAGLEPACVTVCPTNAILVGDLDDPSSEVARLIHRTPVAVRRPEKETRPKVFYRGAHQATLDPLAARRPPGGLFAWSEQAGDGPVGHPGGGGVNSSAAALLAYDVPHRIPWDWRVSLYTWTKGVAAGVYLLGLALVVLIPELAATPMWRWVVPGIGVGFLAATGGLLLADLEHPERFLLIFTKRQSRSWLVRGAFIILGYGGVLAAHLALSLLGAPPRATVWLGILGGPLALMTAVYTAFLFAQAKARDLWQSPLLPPHFAVQAVLAGASALALVYPRAAILSITIAVAAALHLLFVLGEVTLTHGTAHARLATHELVRGRYRRWFASGIALAVIALAAPWVPYAAPVAALAAIALHDHAHVQAGQSVPLA
jgi:Fe-S-cluster-containing dehydrogenase component/formate-dependent nitrite reductase membrane component NrfD